MSEKKSGKIEMIELAYLSTKLRKKTDRRQKPNILKQN